MPMKKQCNIVWRVVYVTGVSIITKIKIQVHVQPELKRASSPVG